jgi:DNA repair protein RadD
MEPISIVIIDECHRVPSKNLGMYRKLIEALKVKNPNLKVFGLTATPFRLDHGFLHEGEDRIFTDIVYEIDVRLLIDLGHLSPLVGKIARSSADLSEVRIRGGEFVDKDVQEAFEGDDLVDRAVEEMIRFGEDRKSWLIFASGIEHGESVLLKLKEKGVQCDLVVGDTDSGERKQIVDRFRSGELRALVNVGVFTTGFNARNVDMIALLRATQSTGLYCQILGRGMRLSPETGKTNCLVLDYGGNIERHGPVDQIQIVSKGKKGEKLELSLAPTKACPNCQSAIPLASTECRVCGLVMEREAPLHDASASEASPMSDGEDTEIVVREITYNIHEKEGKPSSLRVTYYSAGGDDASEWWCFDHGGWPEKQARKLWLNASRPEFMMSNVPNNTEEAVSRTDELMKPKKVWIKKEGKFTRIVSRLYPTLDELRLLDEEPDF